MGKKLTLELQGFLTSSTVGDEQAQSISTIYRSVNAIPTGDREVVEPASVITARQDAELLEAVGDVFTGIVPSNGASQSPFAQVIGEPTDMLKRFPSGDGASRMLDLWRESSISVSPRGRGDSLCLHKWSG